MTTQLVAIEAWEDGDFALLQKLLGDPGMTEHLGGPETDHQLVKRHARFQSLKQDGIGRMFKIIYRASGEAVGSVGYWEKTWHGEQIYEIGWSVLPAFQGRGIAAAATTSALSRARSDGKHQFLHAFPSVDNLPSNAICRKVGFTLVEECEFEYPIGNFMRCNDWRINLLEKLPV